jgi:dipeptidyl aminopeptidase/acylaminoacyl peptidase
MHGPTCIFWANLTPFSLKDYRIVDGEGLATFTALQRRGVPSELLYFPGENHWVLSRKNSLVWHDRVLGWLDQWIGDGRHKL